jgi:hypothetical protein
VTVAVVYDRRPPGVSSKPCPSDFGAHRAPLQKSDGTKKRAPVKIRTSNLLIRSLPFDMFCSVPQCAVMRILNNAKLRTVKGFRSMDNERIAKQTGSGLNRKSGKQVANNITRGAGKNDSRYWRSRIFRPINARGEASPHYSMRFQFRGHARMAF